MNEKKEEAEPVVRLTPAQASARLAVSTKTLLRLRKAGGGRGSRSGARSCATGRRMSTRGWRGEMATRPSDLKTEVDTRGSGIETITTTEWTAWRG